MDEQTQALLKIAAQDPNYQESIPDLSRSYGELTSLVLAITQGNVGRRIKAVQRYPHSSEEEHNNFEKGYLDLRIDFNKVNSIGILKRQMGEILNRCWQQFLENHDPPNKKTMNFVLIELVGSLREIHKQTWGQIVDHKDFPRQRAPKRRAMELYKDYKYLGRGGGWKNYWK